ATRSGTGGLGERAMPGAWPLVVRARPQSDKAPAAEQPASASNAAWEAVKPACGVSDSRTARGARGRPPARPGQDEGADRAGRSAPARERVRIQGAADRRALGCLAPGDGEKGRQRLHLEIAQDAHA